VDFAAVETALRARSLYPLMIAGSLAFAVFFAVG
jgi:hypothetical protein